jgi:hypothetical protein
MHAEIEATEKGKVMGEEKFAYEPHISRQVLKKSMKIPQSG